MSDISQRITELSPEKRALLAAKARSAQSTNQILASEPIAIIGMGCRFPGQANTPEAFWKLLIEKRDAITEVPHDRWDVDAFYDQDPNVAGKMTTRWGGFIDKYDYFDPTFFAIPPREAVRMDPQQRILLEVSYEALESAGLPLNQLAGSKTGVFIGIYSSDYSEYEFAHIAEIDGYSAFASAHSMVPNRLSFLLDLKGPSLALDTACSSSHVAIHLACQSLRSGESDLALAGGVNLILSPARSVAFSKLGLLSPGGRCRTFDEKADGYVRGEGCGILVLKRLSDAMTERDAILAVVLGSAVNQDGRTSRLTAPHGPSQAAVIQQALENAGVMPEQISYVETHGTGTSLGDPIEFEALKSVLEQSRKREQACVLGAVKSNIGHLETASGSAGVIKAILALQHESIPANLHFDKLNPAIALDELPFVLPTEPQSWPKGKERRYAGISAFGAGGVNAHIVLTEAPQLPVSAAVQAQEYLFPLSAHSEKALQSQAQAYCTFLKEQVPTQNLVADTCYTASVRRSHYDYRLAVTGSSQEEFVINLEAFLRGEKHENIASGRKMKQRARIAFVFPGQGSQWVGMACQLLRTEPVFRKTLLNCEQAMKPLLNYSLIDVLTVQEQQVLLNEIDVIQPVLFAIQVSLVALWRSWGIEPDMVIGHSMGEVAAAHVAGVLSLEDAVCIICNRSRLLKRVSGQGAMAVVGLSLEQTRHVLADYQGLSVAVSNSPRSTVVSGDPIALKTVMENLKQQNIFCRAVKVDVASHSPYMDQLRDEIEQLLQNIEPRQATTPLYSTVYGRLIDGREMNAPYWAKNLREPVLFYQAIHELRAQDYSIFLEISPHPILTSAIEQSLEHDDQKGSVLASLQREKPERQSLLESLATLYTLGLPIRWKQFYQDNRKCIALPTYAWQYQHFPVRHTQWSQQPAPVYQSQNRQSTRRVHPFLQRYFKSPLHTNTHFWESELNLLNTPYLIDHKVRNMVLLPAMGFIEIIHAAAKEIFPYEQITLADIMLKEALFIPGDASTLIQIVIVQDDTEKATFQFFSRANAQVTPILHVAGTIWLQREPIERPVFQLEALKSRCSDALAVEVLYQDLYSDGIEYGSNFRGVQQVWRGHRESLGRIVLPEALQGDTEGYYVHPVLLDSSFQIWPTTLPESTMQQTFLPIGFQSIRFYGRSITELWSYVHMRPLEEQPPDTYITDLYLLTANGQVVVEVLGAEIKQFQYAGPSHLHPQIASEAIERWLYTPAWQKHQLLPRTESATHLGGSWLLFADQLDVAMYLKTFLEERGEACTLVYPGDACVQVGEATWMIRPGKKEDVQQLLEHILKERIPLRGVVHAWSLYTVENEEMSISSLENSIQHTCDSCLFLVQSLVQSKLANVPHLWLITNGVHSVEQQPLALSLRGAPLWGLGNVLTLEHAEFKCTRIDLGNPASSQEREKLCQEIWENPDEDQIALRQEKRYIARLMHLSVPPGPQLTLRTDATYLITGGLTGIGFLVAQWLVEHGVRHLALLGRRMPSAETSEAISEMLQAGVQIEVFQADVAHYERMQQVFTTIKENMPALRGVFHAAAVLDDGVIMQQTSERFRSVLAPKVYGAWNLHLLTQECNLDLFVLFSSAASILGSAGQSNYAAANAFLDALAHYRRTRRQPALSINWGMWQGVGLVTRTDREQYLSTRGFEVMEPAQGIAALQRLMTQNITQACVLPIKWNDFIAHFTHQRAAPFIAHLAEEEREQGRAEPISTALQKGDLLRQIEEAMPVRRTTILMDHIQMIVADVLGFESTDMLEVNRGFFDLGMNSLMAVEVKNRLMASFAFAYSLSSTIIFDHPTIESLTQYLADEVLQLDIKKNNEEERQKSEAVARPGENNEIATLLNEAQNLSVDVLLKMLKDQ